MTGFFGGDPRYQERFPELIRYASDLIRTGKLSVPVAGVYPLTEVRDAIAHAQRGGKVLLKVA
jgi:NADPH:quinone reductase-like Zn-dependent oxidoreductase